ncbi:hypothetical protein [Cytobacillus sp.]|uniref:hypothetical protein n=1 Tax=Cytobacillus sp. TaxID=2675269 RepID=UPI0028BDBBA9|nr:hypothetical protein [Cytobacillus sp.]
MVPNLIRIAVLIISWISVMLLPKSALRKYLPVSIFCSLLVICGCFLSYKYKWWRVRGGIAELIFHDLSFIFGPFFAGTLWIFHLSFGNFKRYILLNLISNISFSYPLTYLFEKFNVYTLGNFKRIHLFLYYYVFAFIIYWYQLLIERSRKWFMVKL